MNYFHIKNEKKNLFYLWKIFFRPFQEHNQTLKSKIFFQKMISAPSKHFRSGKKMKP